MLEGASASTLSVVDDGHGNPVVFIADAGRLLLLRGGAWTAASLPAAVRAADLRQAADGTLAIALALVDDTVLVATGVAPSLPEGWTRKLQPCHGLPAAARVTRVTLGPLQEGAPPLLLVDATVAGKPATWHGNAATPAQGLRPLRLPAHTCAVGSYRLPGAWVLRDGGLRFTSFDATCRQVDVAYPNLPADAASVLVTAGSMPNVPDVFVAGAALVVYRGNNTVPQRVADVAAARLLWSAHNHAGEYVVYGDGDGASWLVARPALGAWRAPVRLASQCVVTMVTNEGVVHAATLHGAALLLRRYDAQGTLLDEKTTPLPPTKMAPPSSVENDGAIAGRA